MHKRQKTDPKYKYFICYRYILFLKGKMHSKESWALLNNLGDRSKFIQKISYQLQSFARGKIFKLINQYLTSFIYIV